MPFGRTVDLLKDMLGVQISLAQVRRLTEAAGAAYVEVQTQEADRIEQEAPLAPAGVEKMLISVDGAMVPLRQGEWAEVKTLVIGEVQPAVVEKGEWVVHTQNLSYFSRLANAEQFEHLTLVEMQRRGMENSRQVAAVMDGAEWEQGFVDYHCSRAVRILDFPHAGQRIGQIGQALWGEGSPQANQWTMERLHKLKHQGPTDILTELGALKDQYPQLEVIAENLNYLANRQTQMQYPAFQAQGWPIGSGIVESGNKLVVEARLKGAGMHWRRENVDPMLGLRNIVCSDRWSREWSVIVKQLRQQAREQRNQNQKKRRLAKSPLPAEVKETPTMEQTEETPDEKLKQLPEKSAPCGSKIPAANHPWRHSPIGRARYGPSKTAKI